MILSWQMQLEHQRRIEIEYFSQRGTRFAISDAKGLIYIDVPDEHAEQLAVTLLALIRMNKQEAQP